MGKIGCLLDLPSSLKQTYKTQNRCLRRQGSPRGRSLSAAAGGERAAEGCRREPRQGALGAEATECLGPTAAPLHCFWCKDKQRPAQPLCTPSLLGSLHPYCCLLPRSSQLTAACALRNNITSPTFCDLIWGMMNVFFRWVGLFAFGLFSRTGHFLSGSN